mgnify:CR=1 FL=1
MLKFCIERMIGNKAYPNLTKHEAVPFTQGWNEFSIKHPFSETVVLLEHLTEHYIDYEIVSIKNADSETFYPIALSFFDFSIDWFSMMPKQLLDKLRDENIKILFYYSEGDNPYVIDKHLTKQCTENDIPRNQVKFISANSEASKIDNFFTVVDDELLYRYRNKNFISARYTETPREKKYTALVRMHKYWRANTMATIWQQRLDTDGYFAYGNTTHSGESEDDNPIEVDRYYGLRQLTRTFMATLPFEADTLSDDDRNNHTLHVNEHFENAYINIVLESHMDVDQSNGVFLTEKTFKPIKHSQMFIIFGAQGSLQLLRDMGYKTFDHVLDNKYDLIENTTERWKTAIDMVVNLLGNTNEELRKMYIKCKDDIIHNAELYNGSKESRLNKLLEELQND